VYQKILRTVVVLVMMFALAACSDEQAPQKQPAAATPENAMKESSRFDIARISRGAMLFQQNCAECHGPEAQGHPDWKEARSRGYSAAPPLDGTGHAHKLKKAELIAIIRNGVKYDGKPVMPSWKERVSDQDVEDVILWFQALWPGPVYAKWQKLNG